MLCIVLGFWWFAICGCVVITCGVCFLAFGVCLPFCLVVWLLICFVGGLVSSVLLGFRLFDWWVGGFG